MAMKNTDPKIVYDKRNHNAIDEIDFPDVLSAERMSANHYFIVFDGDGQRDRFRVTVRDRVLA